MRYAIIGVGGVGGLLGGLLARSGAPVTFVARGATLRALAASGLHVKSMMGDFSVTRPQLCPSPIELRDVDVAFVCVKGWQLDDVARELAAASQFDGAVIPLVNGVDGTAVVEAAVGALRT
ncbi:MAG: 2-dehydropantoate 2-reductase N-terminal domain-containing protein, partial [Phycisphaerae bacterium]|nr:2-dehydropantoate 2-reductase N-terminal domain-containing protein [Phycisphaerae bacterium]